LLRTSLEKMRCLGRGKKGRRLKKEGRKYSLYIQVHNRVLRKRRGRANFVFLSGRDRELKRRPRGAGKEKANAKQFRTESEETMARKLSLLAGRQGEWRRRTRLAEKNDKTWRRSEKGFRITEPSMIRGKVRLKKSAEGGKHSAVVFGKRDAAIRRKKGTRKGRKAAYTGRILVGREGGGERPCLHMKKKS